MLFAFICIDAPDSAELRQRVRAEHLEYMIAVKEETVFGGPLLDGDMETSIGSIFAIHFSSREEADAFIANEPYYRNGLFQSVKVCGWRQMVPETFEGALLEELRLQKQSMARIS